MQYVFRTINKAGNTFNQFTRLQYLCLQENSFATYFGSSTVLLSAVVTSVSHNNTWKFKLEVILAAPLFPKVSLQWMGCMFDFAQILSPILFFTPNLYYPGLRAALEYTSLWPPEARFVSSHEFIWVLSEKKTHLDSFILAGTSDLSVLVFATNDEWNFKK